jgi:hypothetical protein
LEIQIQNPKTIQMDAEEETEDRVLNEGTVINNLANVNN